ncbi:MAG: hypothetical protein EOM78_22680, partial [Erysipelotrichia bacterium]|nr:hypothetical protein [Erysipelotrichia bacterium]
MRLLQELFNDSINLVDPLFFNRLDASSFWQDDKIKSNNELKTFDSLFADLNFNDKNFYKSFKTIYHLRNACMKEENYTNGIIKDIRLIYLACHHIIKNRGHFLYDSPEFNISSAGETSLKRLNYFLSNNNESEEDNFYENLQFDFNHFEEFKDLVKRKDLGSKAFYTKLVELNCFNLTKNDSNKRLSEAFLKAISGYNVQISDIIKNFEDEDLKKFTFK